MSLAPDAATVEAEAQTAHHATLTRNGWLGLAGVLVVFALAPLFVSDFWVTQILTKSLWLGLAASSLIFLSAYGGMVSLGQVAVYGTAGLTYANLVMARPGFMRDAAEAGTDSLLIADVPAIEAEPFVFEMDQAGIEPVLIAAANTPAPTLERIARLSKAYTYCVSRAGITGTHAGGQFDSALIGRLKSAGAPPPVFGFGISKPEHVRSALLAGARGVICGSAIVEKVGLGEDVTPLIRSLKSATRNDSGPQ